MAATAPQSRLRRQPAARTIRFRRRAEVEMPMKKSLCALVLVAAASFASGQDAAPDALVRSITQDVLAALKQNKDQSADPKRIASVIETRVLPHFELTRMTQL